MRTIESKLQGYAPKSGVFLLCSVCADGCLAGHVQNDAEKEITPTSGVFSCSAYRWMSDAGAILNLVS